MEIELWVIWSIEHNAFWAPDGKGYTEEVKDAGRYITEKAIEICSGNFPDEENCYPNNRIPDEVMCPAPEEIKAWKEGE